MDVHPFWREFLEGIAFRFVNNPLTSSSSVSLRVFASLRWCVARITTFLLLSVILVAFVVIGIEAPPRHGEASTKTSARLGGS